MRKYSFQLFLLLGLAAWCISLTRSVGLAEANNREGCMNQWLFNGVWRVKVTDVEPVMNGSQQQGWQVTEVWRNGTSRELSPADSVLKDQTLELGNGAITASQTSGGTLSLQTVTNNNMAPSGQLTYRQVFLASNLNADPSNKPKGLQITFNGTQLAQETSKPQFTSSKYNFHFNLGCTATGAAANAEGGSSQVAANEGCLNQWMTNSIWRMRVTAFSPYPPDAQPQDQTGWNITQTWVNSTARKVQPLGIGAMPSNVTDEFIATQSGNNVSSASVAGGLSMSFRFHVFQPHESYTFTQLFLGGGLNGSDKPVRVLVLFDTATQNAIPGVPHYHLPANFRINLTCTK